MTKIEEIEQQLNKLQNMIELALNVDIVACKQALAELKESKKEGKWKPQISDYYWFRTSCGDVSGDDWTNDKYDDWRINNIPIFKTKEECAKYWHFVDTVKEKSYEFSKLEWADGTIDKFFIFYNIDCDMWGIDYHNRRKDLGKFYFKTEEDAKYIIDNFKEEILKYWL